MDNKQALQIVKQAFSMLFGKSVSFSLESIYTNFAFDIKLPKKVTDTFTGQETWTANVHGKYFITQTNMMTYDKQKGWMLPKQNVKNLNEILTIWKKINYTTTERQFDSINIAQSDPIYKCENVFHCSDCSDCKNIVFCDGCNNCEFTIASQRTSNSGFCLRVDDSNSCTNSYNVIWSNKISNSYFIQDCNNLHECLFCSHIANKKYCISNMQFDEIEYFTIKKQIILWILDTIINP